MTHIDVDSLDPAIHNCLLNSAQQSERELTMRNRAVLAAVLFCASLVIAGDRAEDFTLVAKVLESKNATLTDSNYLQHQVVEVTVELSDGNTYELTCGPGCWITPGACTAKFGNGGIVLRFVDPKGKASTRTFQFINARRTKKADAAPPSGPPAPIKNVNAVNDKDTPMPESGPASVYPLDLGQTYSVIMGLKSMDCSATSADRLSCKVLADGTASIPEYPLSLVGVVLAQQGHEYLIACQKQGSSVDAACSEMAPGLYTILVHGKSVTVMNSGLAIIDRDSGKQLQAITPVFAVLQTLK
jgi:hypothetical protein